MTSDIGTLRWAESTGGRLSRRDLTRFLAFGLRSQLKLIPARTTAALHLRRRPLAALDLETVQPPDSKAALEAEKTCAELPSYLAHHSHRTYLWARALGVHDHLDHDDELLYIACLLHDSGLPPAVSDQHPICFTLAGARCADQHTQQFDWPEESRDILAEAITLHLNPWVSPAQGAEAHLLNAGAALDVAGLRHWELDPSTVAAVVGRHPRRGFKREFGGAFRRHAAAAPGCRIHVLLRYGLFGPMIRYAPFDE